MNKGQCTFFKVLLVFMIQNLINEVKTSDSLILCRLLFFLSEI